MTPNDSHTSAAAPAGGPLSGVRVLELGSLIAGPFAGRLLADFGAEVIKIEDPQRPDPLREWGQSRKDGKTLWWSVQSRNKKLVTLNLRMHEGKELFLDLAGTADVIVENFRPGTLEKWGIGPTELWQRNPGLVIARVSGYGQTGPYADRPGFASVAEAMGGIRYLNGFPGETPPRTGLSLGDSLGAMWAVQGILAALYWRDAGRGGRGQIVDVSLVESCFAMLESVVPEYAATGAIREPSGTGLRGIAPSNVFRSGDGKWVIIAANQDTIFSRLCEAMGAVELTDDPRFATHRARGDNQEAIEAIVAKWARQFDHAELTKRLDAAVVPNGIVLNVADIFHEPLFRERHMLISQNDPELGEVVMPGIVPKLSLTPGNIEWSGPPRAAHNGDVYQGILGIDDDRLERLHYEGVL